MYVEKRNLHGTTTLSMRNRKAIIHTHIKQPRELVATFDFLLQPYFDQLDNYLM